MRVGADIVVRRALVLAGISTVAVLTAVLSIATLSGCRTSEQSRRGIAASRAAQGSPLVATYAATKAFVNSLSEALHAELKGTGVSCTLLTPGPVRTEFTEVAGATDIEGRAPGFVWQTPEEVARQAVEGMVRGRRLVTPGLATKVMSTTGRLTPRPVLLPLMRAAYRKR